jgi:predicted DNA binding protein
MREFAFRIIYEEGADQLMDTLMQNPETQSSALLCSMSDDAFWRLDRIAGPSGPVSNIKSMLSDESYDGFSVSDRTCQGNQYSDVLEDTADSCVVYTHFECTGHCDTVPLIATRYLSGGVLFEVTRQNDSEHWRILMQDDEKVGMLYDTIGATLRDGLTFRFDHLQDASEPPMNPFTSPSLRPEQQQVLETAAQHGYYETPREVTLDEIASLLEIPRSTVSYRLRRAESELINSFLSSD